jgi:hypothetical protein
MDARFFYTVTRRFNKVGNLFRFAKGTPLDQDIV